MSKSLTIGGAPNITASYTSWNPVDVYSDSVPWVTGNPDVNGLTRVYVDGVSLAYKSGPGTAIVNKDGVETAGGGWVNSGGYIRFLMRKTSAGTTYFGRNSGATPSPIRNSRDSTTWNGLLCGSVAWSTVPGRPASISVGPHPTEELGAKIIFPASTDNGGSTITGYQLYQSDDGGGTWDAVGAVSAFGAGERLVTDLIDETEYLFGISAVNGYGTSARQVTAAPYVPESPSNVNRFDGDAYEDRSISRYDGAASDRAPLQRWDGSAWADTK